MPAHLAAIVVAVAGEWDDGFGVFADDAVEVGAGEMTVRAEMCARDDTTIIPAMPKKPARNDEDDE